jgi:hypothetical protein
MAKLLPPEGSSREALAAETGISASTLAGEVPRRMIRFLPTLGLGINHRLHQAACAALGGLTIPYTIREILPGMNRPSH